MGSQNIISCVIRNMNTSTIIFNVAAVIMIIGIVLAVVDLVRHKATVHGITPSPTFVAKTTLLPATTVMPIPRATMAADTSSEPDT